MPRSRSSALLALAVATLLLALLTACGDDKAPVGGSTKDDVPGTAVEATAFVDGLLAAIEEQKTVRAAMTLGTDATAEAAFRYGAKPAADVTIKVLGRTLSMVMVDERVYLSRAAGEKYVVLDKDDPSLSSMGGGLPGIDPRTMLTGLGDAITEVRKIGPATIDGLDLVRYAVTLDGTKLGESALGMLGGGGLSKEVDLDLFVDDDGLLRQVEADLGGNDLVLVISGWGEPVEITAPSAAEILQNP